MTRDRQISVALPTIRRLPMYVAIIEKAVQDGQAHVSSSQMASALGLESIQVRKDLEAVGVTGQPGVGFPVAELLGAIERFLGWDNASEAFVIGAGHLGTALAGYRGFARYGLNIAALFDKDMRKIGQKVHGKEILDIDRFADLVERLHVHIAILTVPAEAATEAATLAAEAGIKALWNFTPTKLAPIDGVIIERVDLAASLAVLSSKLSSALRPTETTQPEETAEV
jgi:redox-sensing transcriptional repressor